MVWIGKCRKSASDACSCHLEPIAIIVESGILVTINNLDKAQQTKMPFFEVPCQAQLTLVL